MRDDSVLPVVDSEGRLREVGAAMLGGLLAGSRCTFSAKVGRG
jgi:hypothetical protein